MNLNSVTDTFLGTLREKLGDACFRDIEPKYLDDPRNLRAGKVAAIFAPASVEEVSAIVAAANQARVAVVPYGGGTGLVGGQLKDDAPKAVLVSMERMNRVRTVNPEDGTMTVEAGVILQDAQTAAENSDRLFPLSLASQGSCQIGGNLSTNAGGVNVLRYGNTRDLCLGLEAVLPNGEIWHGLKRLRKDNTGYDLRNLLIGAEGTLGIITAATLRLFARPAETVSALVVVPEPAAALELLTLSRQIAGDTVSAFELIDGTGFEFLSETMPEMRQPFETIPKWSVLIDLGLPDGIPADALLEQIFTAASDAGIVSDGVVAKSVGQRADLWALRENIPVANKRVGSISSHDIAVPVGSVADFIAAGTEKIADLGDFRINSFGHLGDGNLHFNVFPPVGQDRGSFLEMAAPIRKAVYDLVAAFGGSFSAEHGIGRMKTGELVHYGDPAKRSAMLAIKAALDPNGIMNPGVIFESDA